MSDDSTWIARDQEESVNIGEVSAAPVPQSVKATKLVNDEQKRQGENIEGRVETGRPGEGFAEQDVLFIDEAVHRV